MSAQVQETISPDTARFLSAFEAFEQDGGARSPAWVHSIRKKAIDQFTRLRFPTTRDEEWKYTNVAPLLKLPYEPVFDCPVRSLIAADLEKYTFGQESWNRLVFVNGHFHEELSSLRTLPAGVTLSGLSKAVDSEAEVTRRHLAQYLDIGRDAFTALNTAFLHDGACIYVPSGKVVSEPIHVIFVSMPGESCVISQPRNLYVIGAGAQATVVESYFSLTSGRHFTNVISEIVVGENGRLDHYKVQRENTDSFHIATTNVHQDTSSYYCSCAISMGAQLARNTLNVLLDAERCEAVLRGLYAVSHNQHVDSYIFVDHAKPNSISRQLYKGILEGKSRAVFNGRVLVRKDAQHSDAQQTNRNLVLSDEAEVDTMPQLEIYADDVKCSHGDTVGQLEEESIFYLQSRGMSRETARKVLTYGFATEVIETIKAGPIRAELNELMLARLQQYTEV